MLPKTRGVNKAVSSEASEEEKAPLSSGNTVLTQHRALMVRALSQREGKFTPTKSQLGPSQVDKATHLQSSKLLNLSLMNISSVAVSQPSSLKPDMNDFSMSASSMRYLSSSQSKSSGKISLRTYQKFLREQAGVKSKKVPVYKLHLLKYKTHEIIPFKMFKQQDLKMSKEICEQIHHAVSSLEFIIS